jgi:type IV pilus secretin PilQ/predicted competence protein
MKMHLRTWGYAGLVFAALVSMSSVVYSQTGSTVHVSAVMKAGSVQLEARAASPFDYTIYRPSDTLFVVDLSGVTAGDSSLARVLDSDVVSSYRLRDFRATQRPVVRLEVLTRVSVEPRVERANDQELILIFARSANSGVAKVVSRPVDNRPTEAPANLHRVVIEQVQLTQSGEETQVRVRGNSNLAYRVLKLSHPDRLVLDFDGASLKTVEKSLPSNLNPVREVRMAQFGPDVTRVVIDLRESAHFNVHATGNEVTVAFAPPNTTAAPSVAAPTNPMKGESVAKHSQPRERRDASQGTLVQAVTLPANLSQSSAALASPASKLEAGASSKEVTGKAEEKPAAQPNPGVAAAVLPLQEQQTGTPPTSAPAVMESTGRYSGEPISVNLKDVDLKDFFRLIHEISGLNVVLDPGVKGNLTIVLDNVPWDQALDVVLQNNDLDKRVEGNVLRIATKDTLRREAEQQRDLAKAEEESVPIVTTTRVLSYAKAEDLVGTFKKFLTPRGDILADSRSNTLIIRDIPSVMPVLDNLIRQLDRKTQQVEIEARVVAANRNFAREIGTQFAFGTTAVNGKNTFGGASSVGTSPVIRPTGPVCTANTTTCVNPPFLPIPPLVVGNPPSLTSPGTAAMPLATNLAATVPTSGITYLFTSPNFFLDYIITAAESKGVGKLLSKPRVTTQNNTKAIVKQGTKIPIQTIINNTISVQYIDAVLELEVTPQITAEGTVFMDVHVENTQIDPSIPRVNGIPALDTQAAETKILINDGGTVVVGGIIISSQRTDIEQVPLFGSIPLLGNLFRHTTVNSQSQELLFFLTPRILPS